MDRPQPGLNHHAAHHIPITPTLKTFRAELGFFAPVMDHTGAKAMGAVTELKALDIRQAITAVISQTWGTPLKSFAISEVVAPIISA